MKNLIGLSAAASALALLAGCEAPEATQQDLQTLQQTAAVQPLSPAEAMQAAPEATEVEGVSAPAGIGSAVIMPALQGTGYNNFTQPAAPQAIPPQAMPFTTAVALQESATFYQNGSKPVVQSQYMQDPLTARLASNAFPGTLPGATVGEILPADLPRMARLDTGVSAQPVATNSYAGNFTQNSLANPVLPAPQIAVIDQTALVVTNRQLPLDTLDPIASVDMTAAIPTAVPGIQPLAPGQIMNLTSFATAQVAAITTFPYSDPREESKIGSGLRGQALPKAARFIPGDMRATVLRDYGWDALDPSSGFSDKMVIGAQIGTPVIAPAAGVISALKFRGEDSSITIRINGVDFTFDGIEVPRRFRIGQKVQPNVILGSVTKSGKFEHSVHFLPSRRAIAKNSANAIHPYFANAYMI